jgi:hypothetical protein
MMMMMIIIIIIQCFYRAVIFFVNVITFPLTVSKEGAKQNGYKV